MSNISVLSWGIMIVLPWGGHPVAWCKFFQGSSARSQSTRIWFMIDPLEELACFPPSTAPGSCSPLSTPFLRLVVLAARTWHHSPSNLPHHAVGTLKSGDMPRDAVYRIFLGDCSRAQCLSPFFASSFSIALSLWSRSSLSSPHLIRSFFLKTYIGKYIRIIWNTIFPSLYMNFHECCSDDVYEICWVWKGHFSSVIMSIPFMDGWSFSHQNFWKVTRICNLWRYV